MRVLLAAAEMSPLARTGGLGEAVAGLAAALAGRGVEVGVAMPRYRHLRDLGEPIGPAGPAQLVYHHQQGEVSVFLVDDPPAFDRQGIYGPVPGRVMPTSGGGGVASPGPWWPCRERGTSSTSTTATPAQPACFRRSRR